jgi:hypothetical protein
MGDDSLRIPCPACGSEIEITSALRGKLLAGEAERIRAQADQAANRRIEAAEQQKKKAEAELIASNERAEGLRREKERLEMAAKEVDLEVAKHVEEARLTLAGDFQEKELALVRERTSLQEKARALDLEVAKKLEAETEQIWRRAREQASEEASAKGREKEILVGQLRDRIEDLQRRIDQGSQQLQGEAQEMELESVLRASFPLDAVSEVLKGQRGADYVQEVFDSSGASCGKIIWESKRTKHWAGGWPDKLKEDMRAAKADVAVLVTTAMPESVRHVGTVDGVWVADFPSAVGLAMALRAGLLQVALARASVKGLNQKAAMVYDFISGTEFRQAVQGVVEAFLAMKEDLDAERRSAERLWAKREKQIEKAVQNASRMFGSLQGIVGASLPSIEALEAGVAGELPVEVPLQ